MAKAKKSKRRSRPAEVGGPPVRRAPAGPPPNLDAMVGNAMLIECPVLYMTEAHRVLPIPGAPAVCPTCGRCPGAAALYGCPRVGSVQGAMRLLFPAELLHETEA